MSISDVKGDHMDILFKNDDFVFSYRVGGILIHNEKILLQRPKMMTILSSAGMLLLWRPAWKR